MAVINRHRLMEGYDFFYTVFHPVNSPGATQHRGLKSKKQSFCGYVEKITANLRHEQVTCVVIGEASTCESVL